MSDHYIKQCEHGRLVGQCRCFSKDKKVIVVSCPFSCEDKPVESTPEWPSDEATVQRLKMWGQDA